MPCNHPWKGALYIAAAPAAIAATVLANFCTAALSPLGRTLAIVGTALGVRIYQAAYFLFTASMIGWDLNESGPPREPHRNLKRVLTLTATTSTLYLLFVTGCAVAGRFGVERAFEVAGQVALFMCLDVVAMVIVAIKAHFIAHPQGHAYTGGVTVTINT